MMRELLTVRAFEGGLPPCDLYAIFKNAELEAWKAYEYDGQRHVATSALWSDSQRRQAEDLILRTYGHRTIRLL